MNTKGLAKHYGTLSAVERLSLMTAAAARGDEVEGARLTAAAPRVTWRVPHTFGRALSLLAVSSQHRMERLELAALFFRASAAADTARGRDAERLRDAARLYAYLLVAHAAGWARFCESEAIDPTAVEAAAAGADTLEHAEDEAKIVAFAEEEARAHLRRLRDDAEAATADSVANELRAAFRFLLARWM